MMKNQKEIKWLFFDVGSTLVDEDEAYRHRIKDMISGTDISFDEIWNKRIQYGKDGYNGDNKAIELYGLVKTPWHCEDEKPFDDAETTLSELKNRGYKLGIIANQEPGVKERLKSWNMGELFDVIASSAELGVSKPDKRIFMFALDSAECKTGNAVMVGDRLDNDIRPANELKMTTVRIKKGLAAYMKPKCNDDIPDFTIDNLSDLLSIFE